MSTPTPGQPESGQPQPDQGTPAYGTAPAAPPYGAPTPPPPAPGYGTPPQAPPYAAPPAYQPPTYPGAPQAAPAYYGGYAGPKTNTLSILSLIASILGFIWVLPLVGSLAGAIMGHISLNQIKASGEKGRGMALAGVVVGWVGLGLLIIGVIAIIAFVATASTTSRYGA